MIAIVTVTGLDHTGIVAAVSARMSELDINIVNISQTIMGSYFTMIAQCEFDETQHRIEELQAQLRAVGEQQRVVVRLQSEAIFRAMHEL
ncbi:ACT domain-containing protein [Propionibacterium sp.]|uniref:ACT domain-containing protein n=1 Tax=Propionibacterium sp. TaxID=1977903 RepID=UPI0039ECFF8E